MEKIKPQGNWQALDSSRYLVFGAARSGLAAAELLRELGKEVLLRDEASGKEFAAERQRMEALGVQCAFGRANKKDLKDVGAIILSPGIPATHPLLEEARSKGIGVYSEIELGFACSPAPIVAITGSNGKTTTTTLIEHFLRCAGRPSLSAGNIGSPLCSAIRQKEAHQNGAVLSVEVSSFQLETIHQFRPKAALVLNITPDHLDRYGGSIDNYAAAKARITMNQTAEDAFIVNQDDSRCLGMLKDSKAQHWTFSTFRPCGPGAYLSDEILLSGAGRARQIGHLNEIPLRGMHNVSNILAAASVASFLGLPVKSIREAVATAEAPAHRLQFIDKIAGVEYYNDSKATNIDAVLNALASFNEPIIMLAGGRDKASPFEKFADKVRPRLKRLVVFGEAADKIAKHWGNKKTTDRVDSMAEAVELAAHQSEPGDIVLLSPACASFDQYPNYMARGDDFIAQVKALAERKKVK